MTECDQVLYVIELFVREVEMRDALTQSTSEIDSDEWSSHEPEIVWRTACTGGLTNFKTKLIVNIHVDTVLMMRDKWANIGSHMYTCTGTCITNQG